MEIVGISDLHGYLPKDLPSGDVLCICGDIFPLEYQNKYVACTAWFCLDFVPWTDSLPYEKILIIGGNHDFLLELLLDKLQNTPQQALHQLLPGNNYSKHKIVILHNSSYVYKDVRFYGTPYCPDLTQWAFYKSHNALEEKFSNIPKKCDVILTHCPPKFKDLGIVCQKDTYNYGNDFGCQELYEAIVNKDFKLLMCGHVHSGNHNIVRMGDKMLVNVSLKNENYNITYQPFKINI